MLRKRVQKLHLGKETLRIMRSEELGQVVGGGAAIGGVIAVSGRIAGCTAVSNVVNCTYGTCQGGGTDNVVVTLATHP
jgi:hypothetical protein